MRKDLVQPVVLCVLAIFIAFPPCGFGTEEYAEQTGKSCGECHVDPAGGPELTSEGAEFREHLQPSTVFIPFASPRRVARGIVLYLHLLTAIFWFGTILYVHFVLKPAYAVGGLPKAEVRIGLTGIAVMAVTGAILTFMRISSWDMLLHTRFGLLLLVKICLFGIMIILALMAVFVVGPKLKKRELPISGPKKQTFTMDELARFDGREGRRAYIAYEGHIYDVSDSKLWEGGIHFGKHRAGLDLSAFLEQAPHDRQKLFSLPRVGRLIDSTERGPTPAPRMAFYILAYINLILVFLITFVVSLWRW
jgi:predicted heme/steroid binding protein/uncharacterized membrane protein